MVKDSEGQWNDRRTLTLHKTKVVEEGACMSRRHQVGKSGSSIVY